MYNNLISCFESVRDTNPKPLMFSDFLTVLPAQHKARIEAIRAMPDAERKEAKKTLPAATISGQFNERRAAENIQAYNGLVCIDIDAADNPDLSTWEIKSRLADIMEVAYAALSVGGKGVFAIIPTDNPNPADHPAICDFLRTILLNEGLSTDPSCKDVSRLRFISWDPDPFINPDPTPFAAAAFMAQMRSIQRQKANDQQRAVAFGGVAYRVDKLVEAIESRGVDLTASYSDWIRIGFCLANEFGIEGEAFFQRISQFHPKYDYAKTAEKYAELFKNGGSRVGIATLFHLAKEQGILLK